MVDKAIDTLIWAYTQNPGPWRQHSLGVGRAAREIASAVGLDTQKAYAYGLLHDIGRYEGTRGLHHTIAGYKLLMQKNWPDAARICITHSFPEGRPVHYSGEMDVSADDMQTIADVLVQHPYDDYDRLISLSDALVCGESVCLLEKRIVDIALRFGLSEGVDQKWRALFSIKEDFERRMGCSLYSLFPDCAKTTFGL